MQGPNLRAKAKSLPAPWPLKPSGASMITASTPLLAKAERASSMRPPTS